MNTGTAHGVLEVNQSAPPVAAMADRCDAACSAPLPLDATHNARSLAGSMTSRRTNTSSTDCSRPENHILRRRRADGYAAGVPTQRDRPRLSRLQDGQPPATRAPEDWAIERKVRTCRQGATMQACTNTRRQSNTRRRECTEQVLG